jgi:mannosyltransferase
MKITLDNIIFSLQRVGGVSIYWSELLTRFLRDQILVNVIEAKNANESYFLNSKKASNDGLFTPDSFHPANNDFQSKINDRSSSLNFISNESDVRSKSASNSNNS